MKRILALLLALTLVMGVMGVSAFAADAATTSTAPKIGAMTVNGENVSLKVEGEGITRVELLFRSETGNGWWANLYPDENEAGTFTGTNWNYDSYPDATIEEYEVYKDKYPDPSYSSDKKTKTKNQTDERYDYDSDKKLTYHYSATTTTTYILTTWTYKDWNNESRTTSDYIPSNMKVAESNESIQNGKTTYKSDNSYDYQIKLKKTLTDSWVPSFSRYNLDYGDYDEYYEATKTGTESSEDYSYYTDTGVLAWSQKVKGTISQNSTVKTVDATTETSSFDSETGALQNKYKKTSTTTTRYQDVKRKVKQNGELVEQDSHETIDQTTAYETTGYNKDDKKVSFETGKTVETYEYVEREYEWDPGYSYYRMQPKERTENSNTKEYNAATGNMTSDNTRNTVYNNYKDNNYTSRKETVTDKELL